MTLDMPGGERRTQPRRDADIARAAYKEATMPDGAMNGPPL